MTGDENMTGVIYARYSSDIQREQKENTQKAFGSDLVNIALLPES